MQRKKALVIMGIMVILPLIATTMSASGGMYFGTDALQELLMDVFGINSGLAFLIAVILITAGVGALVATCWFTGVGCGFAATVAAYIAQYPDVLNL